MRQRLLPWLILAVCALAGVLRIVSTYRVFNQTWDEPAHVAAGMEWLDRGRYTYEPLHPPLARVASALGPRLLGIRSAGQENVWLEGNAILYAGGRYDRNLALARLGTLPWFLLAVMVVFLWTRRLGGPWSAVWAVLLFSTLPPVLGHAGLATTDMAVTATLALACWLTIRWLERPTIGRGLALGVSLGTAVLSKFSALLFLPAAFVAIALCRRGLPARAHDPKLPSRAWTLRFVYLSLLLVLWAGYRFAVGPLIPPAPGTFINAPAADALDRLAHAPVLPAPALLQG